MKDLFLTIYRLPLSTILLWIILLVLIWAVLAILVDVAGEEKHWIRINRVLLVLFVLVILFMTVLNRKTGNRIDEWEWFGKLKALSRQKEYYREMLMNVFLFVPLGLFMVFGLKKPGHERKAGRQIGRTILIALLFSLLIEVLQYALRIGVPEVEDIICNTIGAAIGTGAFLIWIISSRIRNRFSSR